MTSLAASPSRSVLYGEPAMVTQDGEEPTQSRPRFLSKSKRVRPNPLIGSPLPDS